MFHKGGQVKKYKVKTLSLTRDEYFILLYPDDVVFIFTSRENLSQEKYCFKKNVRLGLKICWGKREKESKIEAIYFSIKD